MSGVPVHCPKDRSPLGYVDSSGHFSGVCPKCHGTYGALMGKLLAKSSRQKVIRRAKKGDPGFKTRDYEFRLQRPNGGLEVIRFNLPHSDDRLLSRKGDNLLIVYLLKGKQIASYNWLQNLTTSDSYVLARPVTSGDAAIRNAIIVGGITFLVVWIAAIGYAQSEVLRSDTVDQVIFVIALLCAAGAAFGVMKLHWMQRDKTQQSFKEQGLDQRQTLLSEKLKIEARLTEVKREIALNQSRFSQLKELHAKMRAADANLYADRIDTLKRAGQLVKQEIETGLNLAEKYTSLLKILDIEYESSAVDALLPDSPVATRLDEAKKVDDVFENLKLEIQANEEVRRLLS